MPIIFMIFFFKVSDPYELFDPNKTLWSNLMTAKIKLQVVMK